MRDNGLAMFSGLEGDLAPGIRAALATALSHLVLAAILLGFPTSQALAQAGTPGAGSPPSQTSQPQQPTVRADTALAPPASAQKLLVTVVDETGVAVPSAHLTLESADSGATRRGETDFAGRHEFSGLASGAYHLRVEKETYYAVAEKNVQVGETTNVEVALNHVREYTEVVNVTSSPPAIDPQKTSDTKTLTSEDIIDIPYPVSRDIRYALPLLPGVVQDSFGQVHVNGSSTRQVQDQLDGFNVTDPASGFFNMRVSIDALRSADVYSSRYSTEFGKGSGGVVDLRTGMGDNRFRYSATDFVPSLQNHHGWNINSWTPRATISGPIRKDKAWFLDTPEGEYDLDVINDLPRGSDRSSAWRAGNLAKAQINLAPGNILTTSFLVNHFGGENLGLSRFSPIETTTNVHESAYMATVKDQTLFSNGMVFETGLGLIEFFNGFDPKGQQTYIIRPDSTSGNFFESGNGRNSRLQGIANLFLPALHAHGRHELKMGIDLDRITDHQTFVRQPFEILREDGTLSRRITFLGNPSFNRNNFETSAYAQDRWFVADRLVVEPGIRFDWDEIVRDTLVSPRVAATYLLTRGGETKLSAGVGVYHDASNLDFLERSLSGQRLDYFYDATGQNLVVPPVLTTFQVNEQTLREPSFVNWSATLERKMPGAIFLRTQFIARRGHDGWAYFNEGLNSGQISGQFVLTNLRRDRYHGLEISMRRMFKGNHVVFASYTRSSARSTAVLNFDLENALFSQQLGGPFAWDTPNRFVSWGYLPLTRGFDLAYSMEWRDGYPFFLVNQNQQIVAPPGARRFPSFFTLNLFLERRFTIFGWQWALRGGYNDITNRHNASVVDNNIDSPMFLTYGGIDTRSLVARIRLLGRK